MSGSKTAQIIRSPVSLLRARLHSGDDDAPLMDPKLIQRAEEFLERIEGDIEHWVREDLTALFQALETALENPDIQTNQLGQMFTLAMDVKGLGRDAGYPIIGDVAASLMDFVADLAELDARTGEVIRLHLDAMHACLHQEIRGDGGNIGQQLLEDLKRLVDGSQRA